MASVSLFSVGKTLLEKLGPLIQQEVSLLWNLGTELEKLNGTVTAIQALLLDAEEQQEHNHQVKDWLDKLTVILFDAEDLLDDVNVIVQKILESATKQKQQDLELDTLIYLLDGVISRKKYVLVLDDVWNFDHEKWDVLRSVLNRGSSGSKILITTRFENYAKTMSRGCHPPYTLSGISSPQSWSLFSQIVFGVGDHRLGDEKQQTILNVEEIKTEIMKKSAGELPRDIHKLVNLWYLSCSDCFALSCMPRGLGELTRLEVLTCFVVGKDSSASKHICGLDELNKLNNLRGQFRIVNLRYLREEMRLSPPSLAFEIGMAANLKGKLSLEALLLYWDDGSGETELAECLQESEEDVEWDEHLLESLEPHSNVKGLIVNGYKGGRSPSWISSLTNLVTLQLAYCKVRHGLHHLQVLPTLRRLYLVNLIELDYMDEDEHGDCWGMNEAALNKESEPFFSSLQYLRLECCPKLKGWRRKPPQFPKLSKLFTFGCPLLTSMPLFPTLDKKLSFIDTSLQPLLCTMNYMSSSSSCLSQYPLSNLKKLYIESIHHPPREWLQGMQHLTALQRIEIEGCSGLEETLNWNNITHVPNIIIDGYYINRDGESLWDEDEWCNFPWILELIFVSPDTLYECFLQKIRSAMNEARVSLLGHSCRDAFKQGSGSNTSRDVSGWIATFAAEENGVHSRGESCWKLLHVDLGEYIRPLSGYENIASQSSVALPFSMLDSGVVAKIGPDDLNSEEELFISPEMKNKEQVIPSQSRSYIQWNDAMDDVLTQVLLDQANQGNKADGDWKVQAYQAVVDQVRITLGNILNKDNVKNRLRQWKKQYAVIIDIQNRSGVNLWDEEKKKVVVTTENASDWQNYLKVNPSARSYANKEVKNWDNIVLLCGKDRATGSHVENVQDVVGAMAREEDDTRSNSSFESVGVEGTKGKRSGESSSNSSKRSKKDQVGDSLMMVANTLQSYYESKKKKEESRHSTKEIYEVLCNIPGLSRTEIAKAVIKYNNSDPGQFNLLLDIPCEERKLFVECFLSES
ncbi:Putative disease resistance RPP13-like protein 1 [Linum perenne]